MPKIKFPYGNEHMEYDIPDDRFNGQLVSEINDYKPNFSEMEIVKNALENPVGSPKLSVLAEGKKNIVILASDHTRPVPSKIIIPQMLKEIRKGSPDGEITILICTGCHRKTTEEELLNKFGEEIFNKEKIVVHDCDNSEFVNLGKLPSGGDVVLNKIAVDADLLVSEGFIEPHFFAGFSGGRKSVFPGIASREAVMYNHNSEFIASPFAFTGIVKRNPIHIDMLYAAKLAKLSFICNVVINSNKEVIYAVSGDCDLAHKEGYEFVLSKSLVKKIPSDIVISTNGGYPLDQNIYQAVKGMTAAERTVKKGGVIIMLSKSKDGHGSTEFYSTFLNERDLTKLDERFLNTPKNETIIDQWESQVLVRVLKRATVIYISDVEDEIIKDMHMIPAHSIEEAVIKAQEILGDSKAKIAAIPDGVSVVVD